MTNRRQQAWVGFFILASAGVLVAVVLAVSGAFSAKGLVYRAYFKFAAGLAPAAPVRYGGLLAGKVEKLLVDPQDSTRIEVEFRVAQNIPVKTDSVARITSLGALGESYLELTTGTRDSSRAAPGSVLKSREVVAIADLGDIIAGLAPAAEQTLRTLNNRLDELQVTVARVNEMLGDKNRHNVDASLENLNAMLTDARPKISAALSDLQKASSQFPAVAKNAQAASERLTPLLDDLKGTVKQANEALAHVDAIVTENGPDIRASMLAARKTLDSASKAVELLRGTLDRNGDNLDETLANLRAATDNLKDMTDTVKRKPSVLIRGETGKDRLPGATK